MIPSIHGIYRGLDQDATNYIAAIRAVPGAALSGSEETAIYAFVDSLKGVGIWNRLCLMLPIVGGNWAASRINLINPARGVSAAYADSNHYVLGPLGLRFDKGGVPPANVVTNVSTAAMLTDVQLMMSPDENNKAQVGRYDYSAGLFVSEQYTFSDTTNRELWILRSANGGFWTSQAFVAAPGNNTMGNFWSATFGPNNNVPTVAGRTIPKGFYAFSVFQNGNALMATPGSMRNNVGLSNIDDYRWGAPQTLRLAGGNGVASQLPNQWTSCWYISKGLTQAQLTSLKLIIETFNASIGR